LRREIEASVAKTPGSEAVAFKVSDADIQRSIANEYKNDLSILHVVDFGMTSRICLEVSSSILCPTFYRNLHEVTAKRDQNSFKD
jgi:hypothetical protein